MADKLKVDLRKTLRATAARFQQENADRLLQGSGVNGESLAPRVVPHSGKASKKRIRINGVRTSVSELAGRVGIKTGAMLKDLTRASNIRLGRTSFKIVPSPETMRRIFAFSAGSKHQVARPMSGVTAETLRDARDDVARDTREQLVRSVNGNLRSGGSR